MRKYIVCLLLICTASLSLGLFLPKKNFVDPKLTGTWTGAVEDSRGNKRAWKQVRHANGKYTITFWYENKGGRKSTSIEQGNWWIKNGLYHEQDNDNMTAPDIYKIKFVTADKLFYEKVKDDSTGYDFEPYSFYEERQPEG